ncbi:Lipid II flippase MurJ [Serratia symbiotica]|nr:Lipid II flippase MurJ [Serratia symbiotica]
MNLFKSLISISMITIFSRLLGFLRDVIIAYIFGVSMETDAFFIAFKFPNLLRRIFAEGAFSQVFIPILADYNNYYNQNTTRTFISAIFGILIFTLIFVTILGILFAPWIIYIIAPGFFEIPNKFSLSITLLRITFSYILFISLASFAGAVLSIWNYFSISAFSPILLNLSIIGFTLFATPYFYPKVLALAWAVIVGGILQLICQFFYLYKINMLVFPRIIWKDIGVCRVIHQMIPAIFGVSISQISLIINTIFSSFLESGAISWIYYADRLIEFPSGVLGVTLGTILLPLLSKSYIQGNKNEYSLLIDWGLRLCFLLTLPSAIAFILLSKPLIFSLFQYGKFSIFDSEMTQQILSVYSIGLIGFILVKVLLPGFYSRQDIKTPLKISLITLIITQIMNLIFINSLKHIGLALSISLSAYINSALLYWQLRYQKIFKPQPGWVIFFIKIGFAVFVMSLVLFFLIWMMPLWINGNMLERLLRLLLVIIIGAISYFIVLISLGFRLRDFFYKIT